MTTINWLNDNDILISKNLADAMATFEFKYDTTADNKWVSEFIQEVVKFTQKLLSDSESLRENFFKIQLIHRAILQVEPHFPLQMAIYGMFFELTGQVRNFQIGDETDRLILELVRCTAQGYNDRPSGGTTK